MYGVVIVRQLSGRGPTTWVAFAAGGLVTVAVGVLSLDGTEAALVSAFPVLVFLLALFLFAEALYQAGALDHLARWLVGRARTAHDLPLVLFVGFGLLSGFIVNDALVLLGVPLLLAVSRETGTPPRPLLLTLAFSVTVGSVLTPLGNPQNLLVSLSSGLHEPVTTFLRYLALPTAINLVVGGYYLRSAFANVERPLDQELAARHLPSPHLFPRGGWGPRLRRHPVLFVFPATMVAIFATDLLSGLLPGFSVPVYLVAAVGAVVLVAASPGRVQALRRVNWSILVLFAGLFLVVGGAVAGGVVAAVQSHVPVPSAHGGGISAMPAIALSSLAAPQVLSNVPWVALEIPVLSGLGYGAATPLPWLTLAAASTLAGNVTLLGAASNLIVVEQAERAGVPIRLGEFVRFGLPLTAFTLVVLLLCLTVGL